MGPFKVLAVQIIAVHDTFVALIVFFVSHLIFFLIFRCMNCAPRPMLLCFPVCLPLKFRFFFDGMVASMTLLHEPARPKSANR